jgi:hypothetical protein
LLSATLTRFNLVVLQDPALWFDRVRITLLGELCNCELHVRDPLRSTAAAMWA